MKVFLFKVLSSTTFALIWATDKIAYGFAWVIGFTAGSTKWAIANTGKILMKTLTPEQFAEVESKLELEAQQTELELLATVSELKEHAVEQGAWTDDHTEALNAIGNALLNECAWDEQHIHDYMRRVVESVPGLEYGQGDPDE